MLAQSKTLCKQEIDAACELIDFFKFNVQYMTQIYSEQPDSLPGMWNRLEYRALEGFVFVVYPFNFTSICVKSLCSSCNDGERYRLEAGPESQMYTAQVLMELFKAAGVPDGVINLVSVDGQLQVMLYLSIEILLD